jgi:tetratricopeptide (TPR) repeat protein
MFADKNLASPQAFLYRLDEPAVIISTKTIRHMYLARPNPFLAHFRTLAAVFFFLMSVCFAHSAAAQDGDETQDAVAIFNEAQDLHERGDLVRAIKLYEKALAVFPEFPEAEYQRGVAELALGKTSDAERSFRRAVELRPDWALAMTSLASVLIEKNDLPNAEDLLTKALGLEPQNPPALAALADLHLKTAAAPAVLSDLLARISAITAKSNPTSALWSARAALESALGKKAAANTSIAIAIAIDPKNRMALFQAADLALAESDIERAKDLAARLAGLAANADSLNLLNANIAAAEADLPGALGFLDAIQRPTAAAIDLRKRIVAARSVYPADLEKQLADRPGDPAILGRLCSLYRRDDPPKAIAYCRRASEAEPNNITHAVGFGAALVQAKQYESAVTLFRRLLEVAPANATIHANLAAALFQLKRYGEAKAEYVWLTNAQPNSAAAFFLLGIVHDQLNEYLDAMANYQQYLKLADPVRNKLDIDKVNLRLPGLQRQIKEGKGKKGER